MPEEVATQNQSSGNSNEQAAPAAPAQPQTPAPAPAAPQLPQETSSPFMDGTSWDQISQQNLVAEPEKPQDFKFADGKTFEETDYRQSQQQQQAEPKPDAAEPAKDTSAENKTPEQESATTEPPQDTSGEKDEAQGGHNGLLKKYGENPNSWASAFAGIQKTIDRQSAEIKAYKEALANQFSAIPRHPSQETAQPGEAKAISPAPTDVPASSDFKLDEATIQSIVAELADDPTAGITKLLQTAHQIGQQGASAYYQSERTKAEAARQQEEMRNLEEGNMKMLFNRVREMKLEDAKRANDQDAVDKYGNAKYQVDQSEYLDVYPRIKAEFDFIMDNLAPKDGKLTEAHFKRARLLMEPPDIEALIRDAEQRTEQRVRAQVLKEIQDGQRKGGQRVVIQPAAPVKSSTEIDFNSLQGDKDYLQDSIFSKMSDEQLAKYLEKANLGYRGSLAQ